MRQVHRSLLSAAVMVGMGSAALAVTPRLVERPAVAGEAIPELLRGQELRPLSLAAADFDGDGVPDLAAGFGTPEGGAVVLYRGNVDALYPNSPEARQRRIQGSLVGEPFLPMDRVLVLTAPPDFLFAGDFDADGNADLAAAARDGTAVHLLSGDRTGGFLPERRIGLPGGVTAMASGDLGRRDGLTDLVVAAGSRALVFQAPGGALSAAPSVVRLPQRATSIAVSDFSAPHRRRIALRGEDDRILLLESDAPRSWRLVEAQTEEERDSQAAGLAPRAQSFSADAAAVLAMRVHPDEPSGEVLLQMDGTLSIYAKASLSTLVVNVTTDLADMVPGNGVCADVNGSCSLRAAVQEANALAGADTITFAIPGSGVPAIVLHSLPTVTDPVTIDGTTQAAGRVAITGNSNGTLLTLAANGCVVRGMVLNGTGNFGMKIQSNDNIVEGNFFGTTADGSGIQGGIFGPNIIVVSGSNSRIGGTTALARNVIAGGSNGIRMDAGSGTIIQGNYIGTDVTGTLDLGASSTGVRTLTTAVDNTIGGAAPGAGNLISGNNGDGIWLDTAGNLVQGNRIGVDATGSIPLPNSASGIVLNFVSSATLGGTAPGAGNLVSGNGGNGLQISGSVIVDVVVEGNRIGTNAAGSAAISNQGYGIRITGASGVRIGGTSSASRNIISGSLFDGILLTNFSSVTPTGTIIQGNYIGTDATGTGAIPNLQSGVSFQGAEGTDLGGTAPGTGNVISGNLDYGVTFPMVAGLTNLVRGNFIGSNAFGTGPLGNGKGGVFFPLNTYCVVGGTNAGEQNRIAFNAGPGVVSASGRAVHLKPNSIYSNGGLGIDVGNDGVTPNRPGFVFDNFPVLTSAATSAAGTDVSGSLLSGYAQTFTIHVFANPTCDASGYGEARQYLGTTTVNTTAGIDTPFSANFPTPAPAGSYITALAVAPDVIPYFAATSELSFCRQVSGTPPPGSVPLELYAVAPSTGGNTGPVTVRITGQGIAPGASVRLKRSGQLDRVGTGISVSPDGAFATATLPLAGAAVGAWDVVVTNPDNSAATLAGAFTVEAGTEPTIWADVLGRGTLVVRHGREQTFFLVFGNRGNVDSAPTILDISIPRQLRVTFVEDFDGSRPIVGSEKPRTAGGSGASWIRIYGRSLPANSSRALAFRVLTIEADPGEFGQAVEMRIWHLTSPSLAPLFDIPIDPNMTVTPVVLVDTTQHVQVRLDVSNGSFSGSLLLDVTHAPVPFETPASVTKTVSGSDIVYRYRVAFASSPPESYDVTLSGTQLAADAAAQSVTAASSQIENSVTKATVQLNDWLTPSEAASISTASEAAAQLSAHIGTSAQVVGSNLYGALEAVKVFAAEPEREMSAAAYAHGDEISFSDELPDPSLDDEGPIAHEVAHVVQQQRPPGCPTQGPLAPSGAACGWTWARSNRQFRVFMAIDPNAKTGPSGTGEAFYIDGAAPIPYTVTFENLETATAAAQEVVVTDQLDDSKLDFSTFALGPIAFSTRVLDVPPGLTSFTEDVDLRPEIDLIARVIAGFDPSTGIATWRFFSLDPATGQPTEDPILGFLPPNINSPEGEGHVSFTIEAKSGLATGTEIHNQASIVFDANPAIVTADWFNTIDVTTPSSQVAALPASSCSGILVAWSGTDAHSGIAEYDVFASENGGPWFPWIESTTSTSRTFYGLVGSTDAFYSIARDAAGNEEAPPGGADATTVAGSPTPLVDSLTPSSGPTAGAPVALTGSGFEAGASVIVGGSPASGVTVTDPTSMTAVVPPLAAGALYDVVAANPSTCADTLAKGWFADFNDVPGSHAFHDFVEKIFRRSVTAGCSGGNYCPDNPVTRAQMAVFLIKAKHNLSLVPPTATGTLFTDVPVGSFAANWIEQLANEGVTGGCGGGNYCPGNSVTRAQMAVFLLKSEHGALYVPPVATGVFADVPPGSFAADWIEQLAAEEITGGCGGGNYCPNNPVTRGQMAVFLSKTFGF